MGPGASRGTKSVPGRTLGYAKIAINTQPCYTLSICFELTPFISWIEEEGASIFEGRIHNFIFHGLTRQWAGRTFCISLGLCDCFKQFLAGAHTGYKYGDLLARSRPIISITDREEAASRRVWCDLYNTGYRTLSDHHDSLLSRVWIFPQCRPLTLSLDVSK